MTPPGGAASFMTPAWTIQPSGTRFDPPMQVQIPNSAQLQLGETQPIYQWDHDLATFVPMGRGTVTEDGAFIVTDAGYSVGRRGPNGRVCSYDNKKISGWGKGHPMVRQGRSHLCGARYIYAKA